ncbi:two-component system, sporulation sensor kinase C [Mariprofundus micogutta]|uniref:histidine kinase n=1 Tax=Mariprofundus micogutta TaxID=1921010 RepID=A0A1L8CPG7_9PROT|nr:ABC transporter substrate-binding protein [Mariprofundus micogutta]GAV20812.1 two-component system, sporulation sensor kinase C [Mariprofundus micogutta]
MRSFMALSFMVILTLWASVANAHSDNGVVANNDGEKVRLHLKWKHQFQFAGYYMAFEKGYYAAEGLNVELAEGGPSHSLMEELMQGQTQYIVADTGALLHRAEGKPVVVLANIFQHSPVILLMRSDQGVSYKTPADLRNKRVMVQGGYVTAATLAVLKKFGINESDYVRLPSSFDIQDLVNGNTDAFSAYSTNEPYLMKQMGIPFTMFKPHDYGIDFYGDALITSENEVNQHPERAAAFRRASLKGWTYALDHIDESVEVIQQKYNSQHKSTEHLLFEARAIRDLVFPDIVPVGESNRQRWKHLAGVFNGLGYQVDDINWDAFIYQAEPDVASALWIYRYWIAVALLCTLVLLLYVYTVQLRSGIRKRTAALEQVGSEYKDILDSMQDAYYRADMDGKIVWVSLACERQLGFGRSELIGVPLHSLYYDEIGREAFLEALEESGGSLQHYELCLKHKDGSRVWVEVNSQYCHDKDGRKMGIEGNVRNINERKLAERESQELTGQLQQAQKMESIGVLAGGIAHDFNNLLVGMMGNAELAMLDAPEQGETRYYLQQIFKASRKGADLVRQMLAYSGQGRFAMGEQNLNEMIQDVSDLLETVIGKHARLHQQLMETLPYVYGDKNQLTQLIMNLMTNASEALSGKPGDITLRTGVRSLSSQDFAAMYMATDLQAGDFVYIEVEDNGCGMDAQTQERIFDPFFTTKETGSGLGLAALLGIVRSHNGTLTLNSELGRGSCFTVYLPALTKCEPVEPEKLTGEFVVSVSLRGTVLVVDDEEAVRSVASRLLQHEGLQIITACDGEEAVELFRKHADEIAFVLLDLTMPVMDGEQTFHALHGIRPDTPILLSSGFSAKEAVGRLQHFGLRGFVRKPYTRKALLEEVARLGLARTSKEDLDFSI